MGRSQFLTRSPHCSVDALTDVHPTDVNPTDDEPSPVPPIPAGATLVPDQRLRRLNGGRILVGGTPFTIIRLSDSGRRAVHSWFQGEPIGQTLGQRELARRLVLRGLAHVGLPTPDLAAAWRQVTVVIPVKDDAAGLARTLQQLRVGWADSGPTILVVDDGSRRPVELSDVRVVRHSQVLGPGPARQRALPYVTTPFVAFIDAGVEIAPAELAALVTSLGDPHVVAAAPRVRSTPEAHLVGRYEVIRSPLDLGPDESLVGPGRLVPYVPTACLVARLDAIEKVGGFDPTFRHGEDVDLVWRLIEVGEVRYIPSIEATHPPRGSIAAMVRQRIAYGSGAAPLGAKHGASIAPTRLPPWTAAVVCQIALGRPSSALLLAGGTAVALRSKLRALPDPLVEATILTTRGHWFGLLSVLTAAARTWSPALTAIAISVPTLRRPSLTVLGLGAARRILDGPGLSADAIVDVVIGIVDDTAYGVGVWKGMASSRSVQALLPSFKPWRGADESQKPRWWTTRAIRR